MKKVFIITIVMLSAGLSNCEVILNYDFNTHTENELLRLDTSTYDYTSNAVFDAENKLPNTLAFRCGGSTDYIIRNKGTGHERVFHINGGVGPYGDHVGTYLLDMDFTANGANATQAVRVSWSFDILGSSNDADFDPTGWTVSLNTANTASNLGLLDDGMVVAQTFDFVNAGRDGTEGWTTVTGSTVIAIGRAGNSGALQIRSQATEGYISANTGFISLDNITVDVSPIPEPVPTGLILVGCAAAILIRRVS